MKIVNYLKDNVFFFALACLLVDAVIYVIFDFLGVTFLNWVKGLTTLFILFLFLIGIIQLVIKAKNKFLKILGVIILIIFIGINGFAVWFCSAFDLFFFSPEYVVEKDGVKYIAYVDNFITSNVRYFKYKNIIVRDNIIDIKENYGWAVYNPFNKSLTQKRNVESVTYYDENGKKIETSNVKDENNNEDDEFENVVSNEIVNEDNNWENVIVDRNALENIWGN